MFAKVYVLQIVLHCFLFLSEIFVRGTTWATPGLTVKTVHHGSYFAFLYSPLISLLDCSVILLVVRTPIFILFVRGFELHWNLFQCCFPIRWCCQLIAEPGVEKGGQTVYS